MKEIEPAQQAMELTYQERLAALRATKLAQTQREAAAHRRDGPRRLGARPAAARTARDRRDDQRARACPSPTCCSRATSRRSNHPSGGFFGPRGGWGELPRPARGAPASTSTRSARWPAPTWSTSAPTASRTGTRSFDYLAPGTRASAATSLHPGIGGGAALLPGPDDRPGAGLGRPARQDPPLSRRSMRRAQPTSTTAWRTWCWGCRTGSRRHAEAARAMAARRKPHPQLRANLLRDGRRSTSGW